MSTWSITEWKREQGRKLRKEREKHKKIMEARALDPKTMPQVTKAGMYWFTDIEGRQWFVNISDQNRLDPKQSNMIEVGSTIIFEVDSVGVGEFIGPITPLSGY